MPVVAVLRRSLGVRGEDGLGDRETVLGVAAVLEDAHAGGAQDDRLAVAGSHHGYGGAGL